MHDSPINPPGRAMMDAMIARAEALCQRARAKSARTSRTEGLVASNRRKNLQTLETTLARLKAGWGGGTP
jgi:hypothetical protein